MACSRGQCWGSEWWSDSGSLQEHRRYVEDERKKAVQINSTFWWPEHLEGWCRRRVTGNTCGEARTGVHLQRVSLRCLVHSHVERSRRLLSMNLEF